MKHAESSVAHGRLDQHLCETKISPPVAPRFIITSVTVVSQVSFGMPYCTCNGNHLCRNNPQPNTSNSNECIWQRQHLLDCPVHVLFSNFNQNCLTIAKLRPSNFLNDEAVPEPIKNIIRPEGKWRPSSNWSKRNSKCRIVKPEYRHQNET